MYLMTTIKSRDDKPFLPFIDLAAKFHMYVLFTIISFLTIGGIPFLFGGGTSYAADLDTEIQKKENDLKKAQIQAETIRADIRKDHPGDARPVENIIQADIAFESHFHQKLVDAKEKLSGFEKMINAANDAGEISSLAQIIRDLGIGEINKKLSPFFRMDTNGNLQIGPAFLGLPAQFPVVGGLTIDGAKSIINQMINDNATMKQKRQDQLAAIGDELALVAEIKQLNRQAQRKKIVRFWLECSPVEIFPDESSLCSTNVEFEDGSFDKYNVKSSWTGAPNGAVRGDSAQPPATVTVTASYQATPEEGGAMWTGSAQVKIKARPQPVTKVSPAPGPKPAPAPPPEPEQKPKDKEIKPDKTDTEPGEIKPPPVPFQAELDCPPTFELVPGDFTGRGCGIIVKGWNPKGDRVEVKVRYPKKSGIDIFPGDTSADASQMHTPGVTDFHSQYVFSESIRANETAPQGITTVTITVSQKGGGTITLTLQISVLQKGKIPSKYGTRPPTNTVTEGGKDAKWCVWRHRYPYEPPECFLFVKAACYKYAAPKYELVGELMTWDRAEALMTHLSRYGDDAYGCLKSLEAKPPKGQAGGGNSSGSGGSGGSGGGGDDDGDKGDGNGNGDGDKPDKNAECTQDDECPTGYVCKNDQCVEPFDDNYAGSTDLLNQRDEQRDEDILDRSMADQGSNTNNDGFTSKDLDKNVEETQEAVSTECNNHKSCPAGKTCENGKCVERQASCSTNADCPKGSECKNNTCVSPSGGKPQGLAISPANKAVKINEPVTFQAILTAADGSTQDVTQQTTWSPGNPFSSGTVGQYTVKATYQNQSSSATISVVEKKGLDDISVNSKTITVSFFDHGTVDGDMIDILINNQAVFSGITLTKAPQSRTINMTADIIVLGFRALNEGTISPNTATVTFTSVVQGKSKQVYELTKNQKTNMNITYTP